MNQQVGGPPPAANTYHCPCGNMLHAFQGDPKGQLWIACSKCKKHTAIVDLIGMAASSPYTKWKAMKAQRWAKSRGSKA